MHLKNRIKEKGWFFFFAKWYTVQKLWNLNAANKRKDYKYENKMQNYVNQ